MNMDWEKFLCSMDFTFSWEQWGMAIKRWAGINRWLSLSEMPETDDFQTTKMWDRMRSSRPEWDGGGRWRIGAWCWESETGIVWGSLAWMQDTREWWGSQTEKQRQYHRCISCHQKGRDAIGILVDDDRRFTDQQVQLTWTSPGMRFEIKRNEMIGEQQERAWEKSPHLHERHGWCVQQS